MTATIAATTMTITVVITAMTITVVITVLTGTANSLAVRNVNRIANIGTMSVPAPGRTLARAASLDRATAIQTAIAVVATPRAVTAIPAAGEDSPIMR